MEFIIESNMSYTDKVIAIHLGHQGLLSHQNLPLGSVLTLGLEINSVLV